MKLSIPQLSLVVLIGPSGSGKSSFARRHFLPNAILSSNACRAMVSDEENNQAVTTHAFETLHFIAAKRLALWRLVRMGGAKLKTKMMRKVGQAAMNAREKTARMRMTYFSRRALCWKHAIRRDRLKTCLEL
ncbi:MAG TPA: AAA family ATPase [Gemmataceae bacterium]|nr:AAA family ATPase [Gemmataceae bacterium]